MKRCARLLLLALCCTLVVRLPAVDAQVAQPKCCCHCSVPGSCGLPGCGGCPGSLPLLREPAPAARLAPAPERRRAQPVRRTRVDFADFLTAARASRRPPFAPALGPPARVPLFKVHCSFLI
jgi:hypothetical protein